MEEWRDIPGYEGLYQVSNLGRVRSLDRTIIRGGIPRKINGTNIKQADNRSGYMTVDLHKNGMVRRYYVHRIVASVFVDNPCNKSVVDHIDHDRGNNRYDNLRWVTQCENLEHSKPNQPKTHASWKTPKSKNKYIYELNIRGRKVYRVSKVGSIKIRMRQFSNLEDALFYRDKELEKAGVKVDS